MANIKDERKMIMTEEQIMQNAEKYALEQSANGNNAADYDFAKRDYLAGAHSRDEEIKELRNHWISVKDRLPENGDMVFTRSVLIIKGGGECSENEQFLAQTFVGYWLTDCCKQHRMHGFMYDTLDKVTHWMPIPKIEKG